jgi:hypothetical protein
MLPLVTLPFFAIAISLLVLIAVVSFRLNPSTAFFANDQSLSMAVAQTMLSGDIPLLGPPSHIGGRHLGPLYYWYQTLLWFLSGKDEFRTLLLDTAVKLGAAFGLVLLTGRYSGNSRGSSARAWSMFGASLAIGLGPMISVYRDFWQPHLLVLVGTLYWWTALRFLKRECPHLLWVLAAGSLCVQAHYAASVLVVTSILTLLVLRDEDGTPGWKRALPRSWSSIGALALLIALWIPTLLFELFYPSNIGALISALQRPLAPEARAGIIGSLKNSIAFISQYALGAPRVTVRELVLSPWMWCALFAAIPCLLMSFRSSTRSIRFLLSQAALGMLCYTLLLARQKAPLERYFLFPMVPLVIMSWGLLFGSAFSRVIDKAGSFGASWARTFYASAVITTVLLLVISGANYWRAIERLRLQPLDRALSLSAAQTIGTELALSNAPLTIVTWGSAQIMEYSYLYFAGPRYWSSMTQGRSLTELDIFQQPVASSPQGRLIACPRPSRERRAQLARRLSHQWKVSGWKDCGDARRCGECADAGLRGSITEELSLHDKKSGGQVHFGAINNQ